MAQPDRCAFCYKPRQERPTEELFYLVEISGPYLTGFDENATAKRSKNKKNMWGCRDCVNVIQDTEYWAKYGETGYQGRPYAIYEEGTRSTQNVLPLAGKRLRGEEARNPHRAAELYEPQNFHPKPQRRQRPQAVNE